MQNKMFFTLIVLFFIPLFTTAQSDMIPTNKGGDIKVSPVFHGTVVFQWNNKTVFVDPYGGADRFKSFGSADLVLISHPHGDHLNKKTLEGLDLSKTELIAPQCVIDELGEIKFKKINLLNNDEEIEKFGIHVKAIPMYNLPEDETSRHKKGWGNGYVITMGGKNIYVSGIQKIFRRCVT